MLRRLPELEPTGIQPAPQAAIPASQTASQPVQRSAIIGIQPRTSFALADTLSCVPEITDTEEVTGSNPVSPTSNTPGQPCWSALLLRAFGAGMVDLSAKDCRPIDRLGYRHEASIDLMATKG
jgi:hypothetical protein